MFGNISRRQKIIIGKDVKKVPNYLFYSLGNAPTNVISKSVIPPTCGTNSFNSNAYTVKLYVPSEAIEDYKKEANVWKKFTTIGGIGTNDAVNVADLIEGTNKVNFGLQGVKIHDGVLYACTTAKSVNESYPTLHGNNAVDMDTYEDRNFADFDQRDWVAIRGLEGDFEGKELSNPFVATYADGVLTPSETITTVDAKAYKLNTFRAENILHGGYSNYAEGAYKAYYVPARVNEVAYFMGLIETVGEVKYLYSNNANGRKDGEGIKIENCTIADNSEVYSILEGILVADATTKAGVKIIMLNYVKQATGVEGVDTAAARIYTANGNIIIAATEDGEAAVYDYTGRLIKSVPVVAGDNTTIPVMPGCYIVRTGVKTQSVVVK